MRPSDSLRRLLVLLAATVGLVVASESMASAQLVKNKGSLVFYGKPKNSGTSTDVNDENIEAVAFIDGAPADKVCQTRSGNSIEVEYGPIENVSESRTITVTDPVTGNITAETEWYVTQQKQKITLTCGSATWSTYRCIEVPGGKPCPPPRPKPDARAVGRHMVDTASWKVPSPFFAPDWRDRSKTPFTLTQIATFYWYSLNDYQPLTSKAKACNLDGQCVEAGIRADPYMSVLETGTGDTVACEGPGVPIETPEAYDANKGKDECMYIYKHSSTTQPDRVYGARTWIQFKMQIMNERGDFVDDPLLSDRGVDVVLSIPVGEVEAVSTTDGGRG